MTPPLSKLHYVNVGPQGRFTASGDPAYDSTPADIDQLFATLAQQNKQKIVLYFHGGMVGEHSGMDTAKLITRYINDGTDAHPISFVWETGPVETIRQNLRDIHTTVFFRKLLEKIIKVAGKKLGIEVDSLGGSRGVGHLSYAEIQAELQTEAPFEDYSVDIGARSATDVKEAIPGALELDVEAELEEEIASDPALLAEIEREKSADELPLLDKEKIEDPTDAAARGIFSWARLIKAAVAITIKVIRRHLNKRDHGFYPTIMEEIVRELYIADFGAWLWTGMKSKAELMWQQDEAGTSGTDLKTGNYVLGKLKAYADSHPDLSIDLVGHSAGSIAICHLMKQLADRNIDLPVRHILFMAPACRCELFAETILSQPSRFKHFRMFTMRDELETKDRLVWGIYTRSLLYFVSGVLEEKGKKADEFILGLQRHIIGDSPYDQFDVLEEIKGFFTTDSTRAVYSASLDDAAPGFRTTALKHGLFDNDKEPTLDSIVHLIKS